MKFCPNCNELLGNNAVICFNCKYDFSLHRVATREEISKDKKAQRENQETKKKLAQDRNELKNLPFYLTTGYNFDGYTICQYIDVLTAEYIIGTGLLSELSANISDTFGTHSSEMENKLYKAKKAALNLLKEKSINAGANSLIGLKFNILTLGANMIVVSAYGTAVLRKKIDP